MCAVTQCEGGQPFDSLMWCVGTLIIPLPLDIYSLGPRRYPSCLPTKAGEGVRPRNASLNVMGGVVTRRGRGRPFDSLMW